MISAHFLINLEQYEYTIKMCVFDHNEGRCHLRVIENGVLSNYLDNFIIAFRIIKRPT